MGICSKLFTLAKSIRSSPRSFPRRKVCSDIRFYVHLCLSLNVDMCIAEILRAARILRQMEKAHLSHKGAAGLELEGGGMEMIDAPMIKQVRLSR